MRATEAMSVARDHAEAMKIARRLQDADEASAPEDRRALLLFWYGTGAAQLRAEEHVLLAAWERHGGEDHPLNAAVRADHHRLSAQVAAVAGEPRVTVERLRRTGRALARHVRMRERELCGVVEHVLTAAELAEVRVALDDVRGRSFSASARTSPASFPSRSGASYELPPSSVRISPPSSMPTTTS